MPALSIVTIPLTARFIFPPDVAAHVPFMQLLITLGVFQLVPLLIGIFVADGAPALAMKLQRPLVLVFFAAVIVLLIMLGPTLAKAVVSVYGSRGILAILVLVLLSLCTGWFLGAPRREYQRTLSIATALRNIGTCAVIATASFPDTLVAPTVLTYFIVQFLVSLIVRIYFQRTAAPASAG